LLELEEGDEISSNFESSGVPYWQAQPVTLYTTEYVAGKTAGTTVTRNTNFSTPIEHQ
jgi:hypothetical protein